MKEQIILSTVDEIKAYSDPYRMQILNCLYDIAEPATVKQIADIMGEVPAKVHYHVKKLEKHGLLLLVKTEVINGIVAKYYEPASKNINIENDKLDEAAKKIFKNEVEKAIHQHFNKAEDTFLNTIRRFKDSDNNSKDNILGGTLSLETIYVTPEEIMEFKNYVVKFMEEHAIKDDSKISYEVFNTIVNISPTDKDME